MRVGGRTVTTYAVALILPLVLFLALQAAFSMRIAQNQIEADTMAATREINAAVDGQLRADQSALQVLAASQLLVAHDWPAAKLRVARVQAERTGWRSVDLTDVRTGREIWQTRPGAAPGAPAPRWIEDYLRNPHAAPVFTGVVDDASDCPCVAIHAPVNEQGAMRYLLSVELAPQTFQDLLLQHAPAASTSAVVDTHGRFIARTVDYARKLGTPATRFVRAAIIRERAGFYPGVTYEGVKNYTAFTTSALTGWSSHIAVKAGLLSAPRLGSMLLTGVAALAALLLALAIATFEFRRSNIHRLEESRSAQSQKLAAVGQLASGIAHDFNNLLMVITHSLSRISQKTDNLDLRRSIDNAVVASERGTMLIQQLLAFTRSQPLEIGPVDLQVVVEALKGLVDQSVGKGVRVIVDIAEDARWVTSNRSQLEMALVNLAVNARDAMPIGGVFTLRSRAAKAHSDYIDFSVCDTGEGMSKEVIDRAMEPFFTTKPLGKGTGLGLAQVFGVVSQSQGSIEITSAPRAGTTILLRLKRAEHQSSTTMSPNAVSSVQKTYTSRLKI